MSVPAASSSLMSCLHASLMATCRFAAASHALKSETPPPRTLKNVVSPTSVLSWMKNAEKSAGTDSPSTSPWTLAEHPAPPVTTTIEIGSTKRNDDARMEPSQKDRAESRPFDDGVKKPACAPGQRRARRR